MSSDSDSDYPPMRRVRSPRRHRRRLRVDDSEDEEERNRRRRHSSSDSSSGRSSNSRRRSPSRSRSRSMSRNESRSRSRSRSHAAAADNDEFTVRIDNYEELFNCAFCHGLLSSRVYECGDGHLTCHGCHDADLMECSRCGSKDYTRSRAVARMVRSVLFACRNREHGCAASLPRHAVEDHERSCRYEPCFCPVCQRAFFPGVNAGALEQHLTDGHDWLLHRLTYGEDVLVDVDSDRLALLRANDGELFHLDLKRTRTDGGTSMSVIRMRPDNAAGAEARFMYEVKPPGTAWRMQAPVWSTSSLRRGMDGGNRLSVTVPDDGLRMVNVCVWRVS